MKVDPETLTPRSTFLGVLITIFIAEFLLMIALAEIGSRVSLITEALLDSVALSLFVAPVLYVLLMKPLNRSLEESEVARRGVEGHLEVLHRVLRHNLSNEMNLILGRAENLLDGPGREDAEEIMESAERLLDVTDKEEDIVKIISRDEYEKEDILIKRVLEGVLERVESTHPEAEIRADWGIDEDEKVRAIPEIEKALYELVENAIIHNDSDRPEIDVETESNGHVEISIRDRGPRIPSQEVGVLMEDQQISPLYHGSSLGLWLVSWIVKKTGGDIEFEENEPRGNEITVRLPKA